MSNLGTIRGFYETPKECFEYLNNEIGEIIGEKKFLNFRDFEIQTPGKGLETSLDFCRTYFDLTPYFLSEKVCFEYINEIQKIKAKKPLFEDYQDFRNSIFGG